VTSSTYWMYSTLVSVTECSGITSAYFACLTWRVCLRKEVHCWLHQDVVELAKNEIFHDELDRQLYRNFFIGWVFRSMLHTVVVKQHFSIRPRPLVGWWASPSCRQWQCIIIANNALNRCMNEWVFSITVSINAFMSPHHSRQLHRGSVEMSSQYPPYNSHDKSIILPRYCFLPVSNSIWNQLVVFIAMLYTKKSTNCC